MFAAPGSESASKRTWSYNHGLFFLIIGLPVLTIVEAGRMGMRTGLAILMGLGLPRPGC